MAVLGQELMLCRASDLDLIRVRGGLRADVISIFNTWKHKRSCFVCVVDPGWCESSQTASVPAAAFNSSPRLHDDSRAHNGWRDAAGRAVHPWESPSPHSDALTYSWTLGFPSEVSTTWDWCLMLGLQQHHCLFLFPPRRALSKGTKSSPKTASKDTADVAALLQSTQAALEQLQAEVRCSCGNTMILMEPKTVNCSCVLFSVSSWTTRHSILMPSLPVHYVWRRVTFTSWCLRSATFTKQTWELTAAETLPSSVQRPTSSREFTDFCWPSTRYSYLHKFPQALCLSFDFFL